MRGVSRDMRIMLFLLLAMKGSMTSATASENKMMAQPKLFVSS